MRTVLRMHEWLADRFPWVQYPDPNDYRNNPKLSGKQRAWLITGLAWLVVIALAAYGALYL